MANVSEEDIRKSVKAILKDADLDQLSAKKVRKMLEAEYKTDLSDRKDEISDLVMKMLTGGSESDGEEKNPKQTKNGHLDASKKSVEAKVQNEEKKSASESDNSGCEEDNDLIEEEEEKVPEKKAKVTTSKGKKTSKKVDDELLAKQLQDEEFDTRPTRRCKTQPQKPRQQKAKKERAKGTSLYSRPCTLLPPLSKVLGTDSMPRPEVVKRLWEIAKERNLQDPSNKQFMLCDAEMQELFGKKKVRLFGMMKILKPYIKDLPKD